MRCFQKEKTKLLYVADAGAKPRELHKKAVMKKSALFVAT